MAYLAVKPPPDVNGDFRHKREKQKPNPTYRYQCLLAFYIVCTETLSLQAKAYFH